MSASDRAGPGSSGIEAPLCSRWGRDPNPGLGDGGGGGRKDIAVTETRNLVSRVESGIAPCKQLPGLQDQVMGKEKGGLMQVREASWRRWHWGQTLEDGGTFYD